MAENLKPGIEALASARDSLAERLAEGHWRLDWPNQNYPWSEENKPTAEQYRRGARRCLDAMTMVGLRPVPADTEPSDAETAALWMAEATHQATKRDENYAEVRRLRAELAAARVQPDGDLVQLGARALAQLGWDDALDRAVEYDPGSPWAQPNERAYRVAETVVAAVVPAVRAQTAGEVVDLAHYSRALDEIYRLRCALVWEARILQAHLNYLTFPKSRRRYAAEQVDRMHAAARGDTQEAYAEVDSGVVKGLLADAGASPTLTRFAWEAAADRPAVTTTSEPEGTRDGQ